MSQDILELKQEVIASRRQMDRVLQLLQSLKDEFVLIKEQNRSSSSSGSRFDCPLMCGADFGKVGRCSR